MSIRSTMKNIIVTGGLGKKGTECILNLISNDAVECIVIFDNMTEECCETNRKNILEQAKLKKIKVGLGKFHIENLTDEFTHENFKKHDIDTVLHFASVSLSSKTTNRDVLLTNILGVENMLGCIKSYDADIHFHYYDGTMRGKAGVYNLSVDAARTMLSWYGTNNSVSTSVEDVTKTITERKNEN